MSKHSLRRGTWLAYLVVWAAGASLVVGCGSTGDSDSDDGSQSPATKSAVDAKVRAHHVAEAWDGSRAADEWQKGYFPVGDPVQLPENGFHSQDDERAYLTQNLTLRSSLPDSPSKGRVKWAHGDSLTLPLVGAQEAFDSMARGRSEGPHLTVTGVTLGETTQATTRGPATVPAWLLTVQGYQTPIKRVALRPSDPPKSPIKPLEAGGVSVEELTPLAGLVDIAKYGRSVTVVAEHGGCDDGPSVKVLETGGSVVLMASVIGVSDGPCTAEIQQEEVAVKLNSPLGERVLLDAHTGRPVSSGRPHGASNPGGTATS